jgi:hypothetical protein
MPTMKHLLLALVWGAPLWACAVQNQEGSRTSSTGRLLPVPSQAPDTVPRWFSDDSSYTASQPSYLKGIIGVAFHPNTSQEHRQAAIDSVEGRVVGGWRLTPGSDGLYAVQVDDHGSQVRHQQILERLRSLPQVKVAIPIEAAGVGDLEEPPQKQDSADNTP